MELMICQWTVRWRLFCCRWRGHKGSPCERCGHETVKIRLAVPREEFGRQVREAVRALPKDEN